MHIAGVQVLSECRASNNPSHLHGATSRDAAKQIKYTGAAQAMKSYDNSVSGHNTGSSAPPPASHHATGNSARPPVSSQCSAEVPTTPRSFSPRAGQTAGFPALYGYIPTALRGTPMGSILLERMVSERWKPVVMEDVPEKWLPVLRRTPTNFENGRVINDMVYGTIALTMPDEPACWIWKQWFETTPPRNKLDVSTLVESTASYIEAYGLETYNRTLLHLAAHGKPKPIFVEVSPYGSTCYRQTAADSTTQPSGQDTVHDVEVSRGHGTSETDSLGNQDWIDNNDRFIGPRSREFEDYEC